MTTENVSILKINKLSQAQYNRELDAGNIDENALYLTPYKEIDLSIYDTVYDMVADTTIKKDIKCITLGNGIDEATCMFIISDIKKDDLSILLDNDLYANIVGDTVNLTALSKEPFSLLPYAMKSYKHILISGDHTVKNTVNIDNIYNKCTVEISGRITLNCNLFNITQSGNALFTGGIYYGNNNYTLFTVPQTDISDRASFNAENLYLDKCTVLNLTNTSGYLRINKITMTEDTQTALVVNGTGLSIPPNFLYLTNCVISGGVEINNAIDLFFSNCDFVNTSLNITNTNHIIFTSCNFVSRGNTNVVNESKNLKFSNCIFEVLSTATLFRFTNNCRGLSLDGSAIRISSMGLLLDTTDMSGYIKLALKPTYIDGRLHEGIVIGENVSVESYFPVCKRTLGGTGRVVYHFPEMNCSPNVVYTIPEASNVYYDSGYMYMEGTVGTEYIIIASHT